MKKTTPKKAQPKLSREEFKKKFNKLKTNRFYRHEIEESKLDPIEDEAFLATNATNYNPEIMEWN